MTRINTFIPVEELSREHLLAEHREIKRIPNCINSGRYSLKDIPEKFTLGKGHVKFFYNKLKWLYKRYNDINAECLKRGYNVEYYGFAWEIWMYQPSYNKIGDNVTNLYNDWNPSPKEIKRIQALIRERIKSNNAISEMNKYRKNHKI